MKNYEFTQDYFTPLAPCWLERLGRYRGRPEISYLEIGVFEGRSLIWVLENILTGPGSRAVAVDPYFGQRHFMTFQKNLAESGHADRVTLLREISQKALRKLDYETFDLIYVDGDHRSDSTITDCVLAWPLLKAGGVMIMDNYDWHQDDWSIDVRPQLAVDCFMTFFADGFSVVEKNERQVMLEKTGPVSDKRYCSRIGQYGFLWLPLEDYDFLNSRTGQRYKLSGDERKLLMEGFREKRFGDYETDRSIFTSPKYRALIEKYGIELRR